MFIPNKLDLTVRAPNHCATFHQNRIKIAAVEVRVYRQTDRMTDRRKLFYNLSLAML